jgi:hypothetical protein
MNRRFLLPTALCLLAIAALVPLVLTPAVTRGAAPRTPAGFFGIVPQTGLTAEDVDYMRAGGIETIRWPLFWSDVQPTRNGAYDWAGFDEAVELAARGGLQILPVIAGPPRWATGRATTMPIDSASQRSAWVAFLKAAVKRYGPGGEFWREHETEGINYEPPIPNPVPIRSWQIWNEANFFYFAFPVSPQRYARLLTISSRAIKSVEPRAKVILSGLFGRPNARGVRGMPAATFLERLYEVPGLKSRFDGIALHPYAANAGILEKIVEEFHDVTVENHDRVPMFITEMGWGSQNDYNIVAFEQGIAGQVRQLRAAYRYLTGNWPRLDLRSVYWFSWKDLRGTECSFCDSVGLFRERGKYLSAKPAWRAFVGITGGRARP